MNNQLTTPIVENVKPHEQSVTLYVDLTLAGVKVTVTGMYNIHSNCFYPSTVLPQEGYSQSVSLEDYCQTMEWDYYQTHDEIQAAVEQRDL